MSDLIVSCHEAARQYRAMGLHPIPCWWPLPDGRCACPDSNCTKPAKHPCLDSWKPYQSEPPHPDEIDVWWETWPQANVALVMGRGMFAVDLDGGVEALRLLREAGFELPPCPLSRTSKGLHAYLATSVPVGDKVALLKNGSGAQVDIRGPGIVIAPPSLHVSGHRYTWERPLTLPLPEAPPALIDLIQRGRPQSGPGGGNGSWFVEAMCGPVVETTRNATATRLSGLLLGKGLSPEYVLATLTPWALTVCTPPMDLAELRATVQSIARKEAAERPTGPFVEPISALLAEGDEAPDWCVDGILAIRDGGFVAAEPKIGKSWLLDLLAVALATAQEFLGFKVPGRRRVLLMCEEDSRPRLRRRLQLLIAGLGGAAPTDEWLRFTARSGFKLDVEGWVERLRAELSAFRPEVVLLDVLRRVHDLDENSNRDMGRLTNILNDLRREFGCGFLIAHHNRKPQGNVKRARAGQEMSGAGVLHAWSEAALYLTKGSGGGRIIVTPEHKDAPDVEPFVVRLVSEAGGIRILNDGPATVDKGAQTRAKILEALAGGPGQTVKDLSGALEMHLNTVRSHLKALAADGAVLPKTPNGGKAQCWFLSV